jgi:hypothetical protein
MSPRDIQALTPELEEWKQPRKAESFTAPGSVLEHVQNCTDCPSLPVYDEGDGASRVTSVCLWRAWWPLCGPMASLRKNEYLFGERNSRSENKVFHRRRPLRVLFIHRDADAVDSCLQELKKAQFAVSADTVLTLEQGTEQIRSGSYDVLVAE